MVRLAPAPITRIGDLACSMRRTAVLMHLSSAIGRRAGNVTAKEAAYEDLAWAFLNSSEFTFNH